MKNNRDLHGYTLRSKDQTCLPQRHTNIGNAYYPHFKDENVHTPPIPTTNDTYESTPEDKFEYRLELSCSKAAFHKHVGWMLCLSGVGEEKTKFSWQERDGAQSKILYLKTGQSEYRNLFTVLDGYQTAIGIKKVRAYKEKKDMPTESFIAIMPAIQHGDNLGFPTQGFYYHFMHGKLIHEYAIMGIGKYSFNLTHSNGCELSSELASDKPLSAIPVYWKIGGVEVEGQYLVYTNEKLTVEQLANIDEGWLNQAGVRLDVGDLVKAGYGSHTQNEAYHDPMSCCYSHQGYYLHRTNIVAMNNKKIMSVGVPVVNLKPQKLFRIGVFFDGTGQNNRNDKYKEEHGDKSRTNVARLYSAYPQEMGKSAAIYVSGVGTIDIQDEQSLSSLIDEGKDETSLEQAFGVGLNRIPELLHFLGVRGKPVLDFLSGNTGAFNKWQSLLRQLSGVIDELNQSGVYEEIDHIVFDVIGFSRGAALSRHFVNAVYDGLPDYKKPVYNLSAEAKDSCVYPNLRQDECNETTSIHGDTITVYGGYERDSKRSVSVRFVGLFDTVGSFYLAGNDDEYNFELGLSPSCAKSVFQITASHEYRENFPLTSLKDEGWMPDNFHQESFPGSHSDVGGGYPCLAQYYKTNLAERFGNPTNSTYNRQLVKVTDVNVPAVASRGPFKLSYLESVRQRAETDWIEKCTQLYGHKGAVKLCGEQLYYYRLHPVSNALAGLSLERMKQQAESAGVEWVNSVYESNLPPDYVKNEDCQKLWTWWSSIPVGNINRPMWDHFISKINNFDREHALIHRSHDTAINVGYDTIAEKMVNDVTENSRGTWLKRNIWNNR